MLPPPHNNRTFRIASYNIRKARGVDGRTDPVRIIGILASLQADIVALQEADRRWRGRPGVLSPNLLATHSDYVLVDVAAAPHSIGWHGNAILVRRGIGVGTVTRLDLPGLEPRGAVRLALDRPVPFTLVATHLGLTRYHRQGQLAAIRAAVTPDLHPTAIIGDFNEWSVRRGFDPLTGDFTVHAPGRTFRSGLPLAALDRLALSPGTTLLDAGVLRTQQSLKASDHLPIWGDIRIDGTGHVTPPEATSKTAPAGPTAAKAPAWPRR